MDCSRWASSDKYIYKNSFSGARGAAAFSIYSIAQHLYGIVAQCDVTPGDATQHGSARDSAILKAGRIDA